MGGRTKGSANKNPYRRKAKNGILLERTWRSMRIIRHGFTIPMLMMTSTDGTASEKDMAYLRIWLKRLIVHGYIRKTGNTSTSRQVGEYQTYALVKNQVERPLYCDTCGQSIVSKICDPSLLNKNTKKERKKETDTEKQGVCACDEIKLVTEETIEANHE